MKITPAHLLTAITDAGCPAISAIIGDPNNRSTWSFTPAAGATPAQIAIGQNVIATVPIDIGDVLTAEQFISRFTNAEYVLLEQKRAQDIAQGKVGNAKNWDQVVTGNSIDTNTKKVKTLKTDLVAAGILTQARADVIFV